MSTRSLFFFRKLALGAVMVLAVAANFCYIQPVSASDLANGTSSIWCDEFSVSTTQEVQACTAVEWADASHQTVVAAADASAYKYVTLNGVSQRLPDSTVKVSVDSIALHKNGRLQSSGNATGHIPQHAEARSPVPATFTKANFFSTATISAWKHGQRVYSASPQSFTTSSNSHAKSLPNTLSGISCIERSQAQQRGYIAQYCTAPQWSDASHTAVVGSASAASYYKETINGVTQYMYKHRYVSVSVDELILYVDGKQVATATATGPRQGHAVISTSPVPYQGNIYTSAKLGFWHGAEIQHVPMESFTVQAH